MKRRLLSAEEVAANEVGSMERTKALIRVYDTANYDDATLEAIVGNESGDELLDAIEAAKQVVHRRIERGEHDPEAELVDGYRRRPWTEDQARKALGHTEEASLELGYPIDALTAFVFGGERYNTAEARKETRERLEIASEQLSEALAALEDLS